MIFVFNFAIFTSLFFLVLELINEILCLYFSDSGVEITHTGQNTGVEVQWSTHSMEKSNPVINIDIAVLNQSVSHDAAQGDWIWGWVVQFKYCGIFIVCGGYPYLWI